MCKGVKMSAHHEPTQTVDHGSISMEARRKLASRLVTAVDRADYGQLLDATGQALAWGEKDGGVPRLEALVEALRHERVLLPVNLGSASSHDVETADESASCEDVDFIRTATDTGEALVVYSSMSAMAAHMPGARPMPFDFRKVALTALVETQGRVVLDPGTLSIPIPRPATAALAQGDTWLPAWRDAELLAELREALGFTHGTHHRALIDVHLSPQALGTSIRIRLDLDPTCLGANPRSVIQPMISAIQSAQRLVTSADRIEICPVSVGSPSHFA